MTEIQHEMRADEVAVVQPGRRLTMATAPQVSEAVRRLVEDGSRRLVVDLSATEFIDSSGLGALVSSLKRTRQVGGDLRLACAGEQVRMVLDLTNLSQVLRPAASVDEAVASFG